MNADRLTSFRKLLLNLKEIYSEMLVMKTLCLLGFTFFY